MKPPRTFGVAVCGALLLALANAALAGDDAIGNKPDVSTLSLEQLMNAKVYGASKYLQKTTEAPASVTIIDADEIKKFGYRNLAEVLRSVRGLYVTYDRNYSNFGIRGFDRPGDFNTRVLLLVDGHRMNDNLYDSALIGTEAILDIDLIDRVEVIRGPSSSIYGSNAFFGVINVITRKGSQLNGPEGSIAGGSFGTARERLTYGKQFANGLEMVLSESIFQTDGQKHLFYSEFDTPANNNGVAVNSDGEYSENFFGSLSYSDFTLTSAYSLREKHVPTASFGTVFNDGREKTTDERIYLDLKYEHVFSEDMRFMGRGFYDYYSYRANYPYDFAAPGDPPFVVLSHDDDYGKGVGAEVQLTKKFLDRNTAILGAEYRQDLKLYQSNFNDNPTTYNFRNNRHGWSSGIYAQDEFVIRPDLLLNAGLRYDKYSNFGGTTNPRLGIIYTPLEKTTVKLLYGRAFRAPNAYELYLESPGFIKSNPNLKPETIQTYELVLEQYFQDNLRFTATGYHYRIRDLITQEVDPADGLLVFNNEDTAKAKGLELEFEDKNVHGMLVRTSYALQKVEDGVTGQELNNSPKQLAKLNLSVPVYKRNLYAGLELQYTSSLKTLAGKRTPGFLIMNATLFSQKLMQNLEMSASVYNLFDKSYAYPGSTGHFQDEIPQDGRSFRFNITYRFSDQP